MQAEIAIYFITNTLQLCCPLAADKTITCKLRFFRPRIFILGQKTLTLGFFPLYGQAAVALQLALVTCRPICPKWAAHFCCRWVSLNGPARNLVIQELEIITVVTSYTKSYQITKL